MLEQDAKAGPSNSDDHAADLRHPEIELSSLYKRLSQSQKGSEDYKQILQDIKGATERVNAYQQLCRTLKDELDRERLIEICESKMFLEERIDREINQILEKDLTLTEMLRLCRLINAEMEQAESRLRKTRKKSITKSNGSANLDELTKSAIKK